jgi:probable rRNA maturation factor
VIAKARPSAPALDLYVALENESWGDKQRLVALSRRVFYTAAKELGLLSDHSIEISLLFADDARVQPLNRDWRSMDKPTNVLSFPSTDLKPGDALPPVLGDIVLAYETVAQEAAEEGKTFDNHVSHLLLHGFLHLLGYDHQTDAEAVEMETIETRILASLAIPDPYAVIADPS